MSKLCRCGNEFEPRTPWQRFCSPKCRKAAFKSGSGEVRSVRQTKTGWTVTAHFEHKPDLQAGEFVSVMRSGRISEPQIKVSEAA